MPVLRIELKQRGYYFCSPVKLPSEGGRDFKTQLGPLASKKGVYVIFARRGNAAYVGQTSGEDSNFAVRLYRHSRKKAAGSNKTVHRWLKKNRGRAKVTLLPTGKVLEHFAVNPKPSERMASLLLEQALVYYLRPELQEKDWKETGRRDRPQPG